MIEIVFGESACGSLKIAQTYGKGKYRGSAVSVFMRHEDGSVPSSDEMKEAQIQAQEQEHIAWENAIPLGGKIKCNQRVCCYVKQPCRTAVMLHICQFFNIRQCSKDLWTANTDFVEVEIFIMLFAFSVYTRSNQIARVINSTVKKRLLICIWISTILNTFYSVCVVIELYCILLYKC